VIACVTKSVDDTRALAREVAGFVRGGDLIVLAGELGAGKTAFTQGLAEGLDVAGPVTSPAFVLVRSYAGRITLTHIDVYRLDHLQEVFDLGIGEIVDSGGVTVVEWGDVVSPALPPDLLEIRLDHTEADDERRMSFYTVGPSWPPRMGALAKALSRWAADQ